MNLSKSRFCRGVQCPKMLWMDKNMPEQYDGAVMDEYVLKTGNMVGDLAMSYYGSFTEVQYTGSKAEMVAETKRLLETDVENIAEAAFEYDGNFCMVDILRIKPGGSCELIEVKSSTGSASEPAEKAPSIYLYDMAYQYYILNGCGLKVDKVCLMRLNREYVRKGKLNIKKLFVLTDCTSIVAAKQAEIARQIAAIKAVATQVAEPAVKIGRVCDNPYTCGYKGWCFKDVPENSVFDIGWGMSGAKKEKAYHSGIVTFADALNQNMPLNEKQQRQVKAVARNLPPHIDKTAIQSFLKKIKYPLYYFDFETLQQAVPEWDGISPYAQIPFQYSLHIQDAQSGAVTHKEFLAKEGEDPRRAVAESLCADVPRNVCIMAFSMGFEKYIIKTLAELFPDLSGHLMKIHGNFIDLAQPFKSGAYYSREMGGSFSIKAVLPAFFPDDPELNYDSLPGIHGGTEASHAFAALAEKSPKEIAETRAALLAYCRLDTLAMVKITERLYEAGK